MGIQGLLQSLRPVQRTINISEYRGKTVAIDGRCILYRGCFGAATKLALNEPTDSYVNYFMQYMGLLEYHGVTVIVVFDGIPLPLKQSTNEAHSRARQAALQQGLELYEQGEIAAAEKCFQQSVTISHEMIIAVIKALIEKKIQCIVAPNEADAQLTHLAKTGKVDAVVTEDSDLLAFGCAKVIYKIDRYGNGIEICMDEVMNNSKSLLHEYNPVTIRHICILSGCDYLPSIKGVGLKTIIKRYEVSGNTDQVLYNLQYRFKKHFPADYIEKFYLANLGFLHQWVYDIDKKNYVRLNPLPSECSEEDIQLLGRIPTVQDSTMFRVNKVIPRPKPKCSPLKESITKEFLTYAESAKENIMPSHLGSPFSATSPSKSSESFKSSKSSKSPKSPKSSFAMKARKVLSNLNIPQHTRHTTPEAGLNATTFGEPSSSMSRLREPTHGGSSSSMSRPREPTHGEPSSSMSRPREPTQGERLEALYKKFGVLPRRPRQVTNESIIPSKSLIDRSPSTSSQTENSKPLSSVSASTSSRSIGRRIVETIIETANDLPTTYTQNRHILMSHIKQKNDSHPPPMPSSMKRVYQRMKNKREAQKSSLSSPPISPDSPSPSVNQNLMPLTETGTISTPSQVNVINPVQADAGELSQADAVKATHADTTEPTQEDATEPTHANATEPTHANATEPTQADATEPTHANATEPTQADATEPTHANATEPAHADTTKPTHANATETTHDYLISPPHTSPTEDEMPSSTTAKPPDTTISVSNSSTSIRKVLHAINQTSRGQTRDVTSEYPPLSPPPAASIEQNKAPYQAKPMVSKWAQFVNTSSPPAYIPHNAHTNYLRSSTPTYNNHIASSYHQRTQAKPVYSKWKESLYTASSYDCEPPIAHINHPTPTSSIIANQISIPLHLDTHTKFMAMATELARPVDLASPSDVISSIASTTGEKEHNDANSSNYHRLHPPLASDSSNFLLPTYNLASSKGEKSKKRQFDQTDQSTSTTQGNRSKKHMTVRPFESNSHIVYSKSNTTTSGKQDMIPYNQKAQAKPMPSDSAQAVKIASLPVSSNALSNLSEANTANAPVAKSPVNTPQDASNDNKKENTNASSSNYPHHDPRMSHSNEPSSPAHALPGARDEQSRKRSFDQTEHSTSTSQGNNRKKVFPALPPPPKRRYHRH